MYHKVDLVVLITSVRSMPRNSDFQEITFYTGHRKEGGGGRKKKKKKNRLLIYAQTASPAFPITHARTQESYTPFGALRFPPLTLMYVIILVVL